MSDDISQGGSSPEHGRDRTGSNYDGYEFTFNLSNSNSSQSSFIEPDPRIEAFFSDDSMSLTDSVTNFPELFGRTYHAYREGSYAFPNDLAERERLELQNETLKMLMGGKLFFAPLNKHHPYTILDIATGTGDWPIAMGDRFQTSRVIATDLSPIQPEVVPPNVEFYVEDSSESWDYTEKFDYIHTRNTGACWNSYEEQIAKQAFEALNPGGWFESQELQVTLSCDDGTLDPNCAMACWFRDLEVAADASLRPLSWANRLRGIYERVGFVDIHERIFKIPSTAGLETRGSKISA
ncbi:Methyltransferase pytC [Cladobotryum mycophilum]|uniref:Methyltransferase pytC n=1 Tax=Cladobotryum mycophilum TaxID=491253 RepID=A0ABR0S4Y5_9HYPO